MDKIESTIPTSGMSLGIAIQVLVSYVDDVVPGDPSMEIGLKGSQGQTFYLSEAILTLIRAYAILAKRVQDLTEPPAATEAKPIKYEAEANLECPACHRSRSVEVDEVARTATCQKCGTSRPEWLPLEA